MRERRGLVALLVGAVAALAGSPGAQDLAVEYPATLDYVKDEDERFGLLWTCDATDVWKLSRFQFEVEDRLELRLGSGQLVIGQNEGNALWATYVPDRPAKLSSSSGGDGEKITSLFLRFHPARIGDLFPAKNVRGQGDAEALFEAYRIYRGKIVSEWNRFNLPVVPPKDVVVIDADTEDNRRRVFSVNTSRGRVDYKSGYVTRALPVLPEVKKRDAYAIVEEAWRTVDDKYALFDAERSAAWTTQLDEAKKAVARAETTFDVGVGIRHMLDALKDDDVWVYVGNELVSCTQFRREFNASWSGINYVLGDVTHDDRGLSWARTPHNVGYINLRYFGDDDVVEALDETLETIGDTWAMILDLRFTRYGDRDVAEKLSGRFLPEEAVYGYVQERAGAHEEFADAEELVCPTRGPWTYEAPLYLLVGPGTARQGEQLALMLKRAPKVVTCGEPTLGLNSNNERIELEGGLTLVIPTRRDLTAEGEVVQGAGILPDLAIETPDDVSDDEDPVLYRALEEVLKTPVPDRKVGNRNAPGASDEAESGEVEDQG